jgi:DNA-binding transcriptional MerR regulator
VRTFVIFLIEHVVSGEIDVFPVGYRIYDQAAVKRLRFIKQAQTLGFRSMKFGEFLSLRGRGKETRRCVIAMTETTLAEIEGKLKELQKFRDALKAILVRWRQSSDQGGQIVAEFCALIESTQERANGV